MYLWVFQSKCHKGKLRISLLKSYAVFAAGLSQKADYGWPGGIGEEDIPAIVRILTVTDAYAAMTSHRPYRKPLSIQAAIKELERCAGTWFDPAVVGFQSDT